MLLSSDIKDLKISASDYKIKLELNEKILNINFNIINYNSQEVIQELINSRNIEINSMVFDNLPIYALIADINNTQGLIIHLNSMEEHNSFITTLHNIVLNTFK